MKFGMSIRNMDKYANFDDLIALVVEVFALEDSVGAHHCLTSEHLVPPQGLAPPILGEGNRRIKVR